ncbi:response regulator transcription factor [Psychroserpens sp.]|uniref:response regulator transcription factor n=1 Tax=Psychroserpens sp. TaxID=2020870 RepID=UPI001B1948A9|nr:response regulator transcription factor [Psychroserpens sp.]MBO6605458.1 response regulator transcription factor [Psychroserpens sp.]MBO6653733.1 response regulator transcription factor [Psychroserpens sp.]MBO6682054.1 response regulator transcription factor [Psychroserpens sp.]MBO6748832.1 response regulator transcription factor [Psychroserpens sp.]MBO6915351.1 response regulator transcription factor [Psychroserpens sp.]
MKTILLAEDDLDFGNILKQYLEISGFEITWAKDGAEALDYFKAQSYDICVFDVMMPKMDGFTLAENIIDVNPECPFIFLTARKLKEDKIKGLKLGADDYIVKPFEADELVLRLNNIIRRAERSFKTIQQTEVLSISTYTFDTKRLVLNCQDYTKQLTQKEAELILFLVNHKNQLLKREEVLTAVWENDDFFSGRSMDVFISRLRKYFQHDPSISIESKRNVGLEFKVS